MLSALKKQVLNIFTKVMQSNRILLISFTIIAVLFSELLVYLQLNIFWQDQQNYEMVYYIGFWTPLIDALFIVFFIIAIKSMYEKYLKEKTQELDIYFNTMRDAFVVTDLDSKKILNCNKAFENLTGYTKDELAELTIDKLHPQDSLPYIIDHFQREVHSDILYTIPVLHKSGSAVTMCEIATSNYRTNSKNINVGVFRNITDRLQLEEELKNLNKNLEQRVKDEVEKNRQKDQHLIHQSRLAQMGEMISMIAHQWRQPISAIAMGANNILADIELDTLNENTLRKGANDIVFMTQELSKTIDDFRTFYKQNKQSAIVKLEDVIEKSLNIIKPSLINNNINIIQEYNSDEEIEIYESEVMHVILNILNNAKESFKERETKDQTILIKTKNRTISIYNNGEEIPEVIIDKIFDPYFSTKEEKNGTGLGLYMSKTIIENNHNGKLSVKNRDDGVCFTIEFGVISKK